MQPGRRSQAPTAKRIIKFLGGIIIKTEARELYVYTVDHFEKELNRISKDSACASMAVRQVVKKAIVKYCNEYTDLKITQATEQEIFSDEDFKDVSNQIADEILNR